MTSSALDTQHPVECPGMAVEVWALNRRYLRRVQARALVDAATVDAWRNTTVDVFLRHQSDHVFAIAAADEIGMANFVAIEQARFRVDQPGREQAIQSNGALPNGRNVHAFVSGRLLWAAMIGPEPDSMLWQAVEYIPSQMKSFRLAETKQPVVGAAFVLFVPGKAKVWCLNPVPVLLTEASS